MNWMRIFSMTRSYMFAAALLLAAASPGWAQVAAGRWASNDNASMSVAKAGSKLFHVKATAVER